MDLPDPDWTVPRVLGVDDFATRRGRHYGTMLIYCEAGQPLDLPPGRDADTLASWPRSHPGAAPSARTAPALTPTAFAPERCVRHKPEASLPLPAPAVAGRPGRDPVQ
jgi:hypothetical protein